MADKKVLYIPEMITVGELAEKLNLPVAKLVGELFKNGIMATINQRIDFETAEIIISELEIDATLEHKSVAEVVEHKVELSKDAKPRPPIVAIMGHVDHGKTTLIDNIMGTSVVRGEAGGITQHIAAYQTERKGRKITLLDTPGHEAFAALRQHGATLTDVVVIVVAADDGVKPQTVEAIKFARTANAKIVVAINKMDKETANPNLVKTQLATEFNLNPEEWGGDTVMVEVSAKTGQNLDKLLDMVLLVADIEDLRADRDVPADGLVIESNIEQGRGAVVRILISNGTLRVGEYFVAGSTYGRVRTLQDFAGKALKSAGPSTPATITGFKEVPEFGQRIEEVKNEREARALAAKHYEERVQSTAGVNITGSDLLKMMNRASEQQIVEVVVKADVQGSLTSVVDSLKLLETDEVAVKIIASGVGNITEGDVRVASSSKTIIYGFNVVLPSAVKQLAHRAKTEIRLYNVIYELLDDVKSEMERLLPPDIIESPIGELDVKGVFRTTKDAIIAGGLVKSGKITPNILARIWRGGAKKVKRTDSEPDNEDAIKSSGGELLAEAEIKTVQREKSEVKEVFEGEMCGLELELKRDGLDPDTHEPIKNIKFTLEIGDRLECFTREMRARKL
ncbi:translation initiation factor IF-2 [Candidatus Saccharibacteria bacterium]|nr:translation initiation factor IF-2 [Candidatus Saccharibacteria bacterium]MCL1963305.1 translation initiation factor IF-2 [Candidatus Saccharibacteria bacterium]